MLPGGNRGLTIFQVNSNETMTLILHNLYGGGSKVRGPHKILRSRLTPQNTTYISIQLSLYSLNAKAMI